MHKNIKNTLQLKFDLNIIPKNANTLADSILSKVQLPDLKIILDVSAEVGYKRKMDGTSINYLEQREPFYQTLFGDKNAVHFNGLEPVEALSQKIFNYVNNHCFKRQI